MSSKTKLIPTHSQRHHFPRLFPSSPTPPISLSLYLSLSLSNLQAQYALFLIILSPFCFSLKLKLSSMDSFAHPSGFRYNHLNSSTMDDPNLENQFSGILEIYIHHAQNIRNICIYHNQDVYAKFSLTSNPDETLTTKIVNGGGKNPVFDQNFSMKITHVDSVLKCEILMLSRARNYMEDQLLGFVLVPLSHLVGKGKLTQDYALSSTDLFHSPAGNVQLTLDLIGSSNFSVMESSPNPSSSSSSSISSEVVLLDRKITQAIHLDPIEYSSIEFPEINVVRENQQMVSDYFNSNGEIASFLHLGSSHSHHQQSPVAVDDYEMTTTTPTQTTTNSSNNNDLQVGSISPNGSSSSIQNSSSPSGFLSSITTSLSEDRNSADSIHKKIQPLNIENSNSTISCPDTPTSRKATEIVFKEEKEKEIEKEEKSNCAKFGQVFGAPLGNNINLEAEQSAMQKQIVDMYMRSMQQFTESLAKMKLPMDLDKPESEENQDGVVILSSENNSSCNNNEKEVEKKKKMKKKDGSRVFYGSRAFF